jgi:hypothetical protein
VIRFESPDQLLAERAAGGIAALAVLVAACVSSRWFSVAGSVPVAILLAGWLIAAGRCRPQPALKFLEIRDDGGWNLADATGRRWKAECGGATRTLGPTVALDLRIEGEAHRKPLRLWFTPADLDPGVLRGLRVRVASSRPPVAS